MTLGELLRIKHILYNGDMRHFGRIWFFLENPHTSIYVSLSSLHSEGLNGKMPFALAEINATYVSKSLSALGILVLNLPGFFELLL